MTNKEFDTSTSYKRIPFNKPCFVGKELVYIAEAVANGHISGDGPFSQKCHAFLEREIGVQNALLTTSCTHALEMAAILLNIQPYDEVIVPSFTFVTTVNAFVLRGAKPVFVDIRPDTLNINESLIEDLITDHTRAIIPVHYAGVGCEMDSILKVAKQYGLSVVEDNAHGLFGKYKGKYLGTFGRLATQSFHETKNIQCGEGGALLINDPELSSRAEIIREKGTNRSKFFRGQVDKYGWVDIGSSYLPSDLLAAVLLAQLEEKQTIQHKRKLIWHYYYDQLIDWASENGVKLPYIPSHCEQSYHMFYMIMPTQQSRQEMITHLKYHDIHAVFHYVPLHSSEMGCKTGGDIYNCFITDYISDRLLRLPFYNDLTLEDQIRVIDCIREYHV